jgi:hypothetical protein
MHKLAEGDKEWMLHFATWTRHGEAVLHNLWFCNEAYFLWVELSISKMFDCGPRNIYISFTRETVMGKNYCMGIIIWPCCITASCHNLLKCQSVPSGLCKMRPGHTQLMWSLIFCMKPLVLGWYIIILDATIVDRFDHPTAQTLIHVISFCGASCQTNTTQGNLGH